MPWKVKTILIVTLIIFSYPACADFFSQNELNEKLMNACGLESVLCEGELPMKEWVLNEFKTAGLDPVKTEKIIECESRWDRYATNKNRNGSSDFGLFQLNDRYTDPKIALNYKTATARAIEIVKQWGSWNAFVCAKLIN